MTESWGIKIMIFGLLGVLLFSTILMPIFTTGKEIIPEGMSSIDCIARYAKLQSSAAAISPYIMTAPKGLRGELIAAQGRWYITAKGIVCGTAVGETFAQALFVSEYMEKHADECIFPGACISLKACTEAGKTILVPGINEKQKRVVMESACLPCLQVANYILQKNQEMAKQAEETDGVLSVAWTRYPP